MISAYDLRKKYDHAKLHERTVNKFYTRLSTTLEQHANIGKRSIILPTPLPISFKEFKKYMATFGYVCTCNRARTIKISWDTEDDQIY